MIADRARRRGCRMAAAREVVRASRSPPAGRSRPRDPSGLPALPARGARAAHGCARSTSIKDYSATPRGYLASAGRVHFSTWSGRFFKDPVDSFFPGSSSSRSPAIGHRSRRRRRRRQTGDPTRAQRGDAGRDRRRRASCCRSARRRRSTAGCSRSFRRCRACARRRASATCSCSRSPSSAGWTGGLRASSVRLGCARSAIVLIVLVNVESLRAVTYQRSAAFPRSCSLLASEPGPVVAGRTAVLPRWAIFPERRHYVLASTGALAAADERLQRLHAATLPALRGRVLVFSARTGRSRR